MGNGARTNELYRRIIRALSFGKRAIYGKRLPRFMQPFVRRFIKPHLPPHVVMLAVTYRCQARCRHCMVKNYIKKDPELTLDEIADVIDQAAKIGTKCIYYFGGEPLVRSDFVDIIRITNEAGRRARFDTNGALLDADTARRLREVGGLYIVGVSVDSPDAAHHDAHRGLDGSFDDAVRAIENCKVENIPVHISYYVTKDGLHNGDLQKTIALGRDLGVDGIRVMSPIICGRLVDSPDMKFTREEERELQTQLIPGFVYLEQDSITSDCRCPAFQKEYLYISCYGEVQPCCFVPVTFGNIREEPLAAVVQRMWKSTMFAGDNDKCLGCSVPHQDGSLLDSSRHDLPVDFRNLER